MRLNFSSIYFKRDISMWLSSPIKSRSFFVAGWYYFIFGWRSAVNFPFEISKPHREHLEVVFKNSLHCGEVGSYFFDFLLKHIY